ncbi:MAG: hypothetical protein ACREOU_00860 [Candidatus Eiseniibacteriota bacterium]
MRSFQALLLLMLLVLPAIPCHAQSELAQDHRSTAVGFSDFEAPLGVRWWLGESHAVGLDFGVGFFSGDVGAPGGGTDVITGALAFPVRVTSWDRLRVAIRPGLKYQRREFTSIILGGFISDEASNAYSVSVALEPEFFLIRNFSVSAAVGAQVRFTHYEESGEDTSEFFSQGQTLLGFGVHAYLFGGAP